jgi:2-polyprenyl-6-hydroxyphenyl methylase/3-demethylubiquinone-9 3-methyltransferase
LRKCIFLRAGWKLNIGKSQSKDLADEQPGQYDIVTCMELLEHVPDPSSIVQACARLVGPGGRCFFSTINRNPKSYLFAVLGAEYLLNLLPRGTHDYSRFIKPAETRAHIAAKPGILPDHLTA